MGTTMSNSVQGLIGNLWASGMLIVLHGIFPGGYQGDNPVAFWVGLSGSLLFIFAFMYLNVNANVQFFALYGYVGYAMTFLDPNNSSRVSEAFTLDHQGVAVNAVILFAIGAVLAILCSLLPWPVTARSLMLMKAEAALDLTFSLYRQIVEYYVGSSASMQIVELMSNVKKIRSDLDEASGAIGAAWWGCFGLGSSERSRQCVGQLCESLEKILTHIEPLMAVVSREGFEPRHTQLTSQIRSELLDVVNKTEALFKFAFETTRDGVLAPNEKAICEQDLAELDASVNNLLQKMRLVERQINAQKITRDTTGENYMVTAAKEIAGHASERAKGLIAEDHPRSSLLGSMKDDIVSVFDTSVLLSRDHLAWVFRNTLSLLLCFGVGYYGWGPGCKKEGRSCFINPYNASMASLVIVLLSKFVGSTFKNAIDRLTAVVLANVIGQLAYVLVGWCTLGGRIATGVTVFIIVTPCMYVAYMGGSYASIGMRLAAIGAMCVLAPCSNEYITSEAYAYQYHAISDIVVGASIMLMVDMMFGGKPASALCRDTLTDAMKNFKMILEDFTSGKFSNYKDLEKRIKDVQGQMGTVKSLSDEAAKEPRFWRQRWRPSLYTTLTDGFMRLSRILHVLVHLIEKFDEEDDKYELKAFLSSIPAHSNCMNEVDSMLGFLVDLSTYILHLDYPEEMVGLDKMMKSEGEEHLPLDDLVKQMNSKQNSPTLTFRLSMIVETLSSLAKELKKNSNSVVLHKSS